MEVVALVLTVVALALLQVFAEDSCTSVSNWRDFKNAAKGNITFCPFVIDKPELARLIVTSETSLTCLETKQCVIRGTGNHISVRGLSSRLSITGFSFSRATDSAIRIAQTSKIHVIRSCAFRSNRGPLTHGGRGGAIRTEAGTRLTVISTRFVDNQARAGGAIAHLGAFLSIRDSIFKQNLALRGGGVFVSAISERIHIKKTKFLSNLATATPSGAISIGSINTTLQQMNVVGINNDGCNGFYVVTKNHCDTFLGAATPTSFVLGELNSQEDGVRLSQGLTARIIARAGKLVTLTSTEAANTTSSIPFHVNPDGAAVFALNGNRFIYVSNSEEPGRRGGVYGLEFDSQGRTRDYKPLLTGSSRNCNGGITPWKTWVSCEEVSGGQCHQIDPHGRREAEPTVLGGSEGGFFEAFAYDDRNTTRPAFFVTEDREDGAVRRFRPYENEPFGWDMLHRKGTIDYLEMISDNAFRWTSSLPDGRKSAKDRFKNCEGITHHDGILMFVSKVQHELFRLDLDRGTYSIETTKAKDLRGGGSFGNGPDHLLATSEGLLYFSEDGGPDPGVYVYDGSEYKTLLQAYAGRYENDETTGIAFSPDQRFIFVCFQEAGALLQVSRIDGLPFNGRRILNWKYDLGRKAKQ